MKTEYWAEKLRGHISAVNRKQRTEQEGKQKQRVGEPEGTTGYRP